MGVRTFAAVSTFVFFLAACSTPETGADAQLSSQVLRGINAHLDLRADRLNVQTSDRVVYLNGMTDTWREYYEAEEIARAIPGVLRVVNKIAVENRYG